MSRALAAVPALRRRALVYVRVSDEAGRGVDLLSPAIQRRAADEFCQRENIDVVGYIEDINMSGRYWAKRKIEGAVARVEAGEVDTIVVWKWSRVARDPLDWAKAAARVDVAGGELLSATEPFDPSASGMFNRDVLVALAVMDSRTIGDGWRSAHRERFEAGLPHNGRVQWCMTNTRRGVDIDPERADVVRELYRRYIGGERAYSLAAWLRETGQPTKRGKPWQPGVVHRMLDSPMHAGYVTYQGEQRPGSFEAVIDDDTWQSYQAQRRDSRRAGRRQSSPFLLSGLARCSECGHAMSGSSSTTNKGESPRMRCGYRYEAGVEHAAMSSVTAAALDAAVLGWLADRAAGIDELVDQLPVVAVQAGEAARLTTQIAELDRKLARATGLLIAETISERAYADARAELEPQRAELAAALTAAVDREHLATAAPLRQAASDLLAEWDELPVLGQRAALRALIHHVTVWTQPELRIEVTPM